MIEQNISGQNIIGQKFGRLTIIEIFYKKNRKHVKCICECSKIIESRFDNLKCGDTVSCGCYKKDNNVKLYKINLIGKRFGKLLVIEDAPKVNNRYVSCKCKCDCGNEKIIAAFNLRNGATISCGCRGFETRFKRVNKPIITSINYIFKFYSDGDLTIDDFVKLSSQNCHYCNSSLTNYCNISIKSYSKFDSEFDFHYNGLDRLDNSRVHDLDNVVTCCKYCNRSKNSLNYNEFLIQTKNIYEFCILSEKYKLLEIKLNDLINSYLLNSFEPNKELLTKANSYFGTYKYNKPGNILLKDFAKLSQFNCFYCNSFPSNGSENFKYSGLDRVDNNRGHDIDNVIPCCISCNRFKMNKSLNEFADQVTRIYTNLNLKNYKYI